MIEFFVFLAVIYFMNVLTCAIPVDLKFMVNVPLTGYNSF